MAINRNFEKVPLEIVGIGETTDRVVEILLKGGGKARIRRDLLEIYGSLAYVPRWLAKKITKNKREQLSLWKMKQKNK